MLRADMLWNNCEQLLWNKFSHVHQHAELTRLHPTAYETHDVTDLHRSARYPDDDDDIRSAWNMTYVRT